MSTLMVDDIKLWTAKSKTALVPTSSRARPRSRKPTESSISTHPKCSSGSMKASAAWRTPCAPSPSWKSKSSTGSNCANCRKPMAKLCWSCVPEKKTGVPAGHRGREMTLGLQQGLAQDGVKGSLIKLCQWFDIPRRTVYYRSTKAAPKAQDLFVKPNKVMVEAIAPWRTCSASTRTRCSASSSSRASRFASDRCARCLASRLCLLWPRHQTSVGSRSCAGYRRGRDGWASQAPW